MQPELMRVLSARTITVGAVVILGVGMVDAAAVLNTFPRIADDTRHDAGKRRGTELCTKAVEQFGREQVEVRLGGLYDERDRTARHGDR